MRIRGVELRRLELTLREPVETASGTHDARPIVLVRVTTDESIGTGECEALERAFYSGEDADGEEVALTDVLIPRLVSIADLPNEVSLAMRAFDEVVGHSMAKAAIEMALLDAVLRAEGRSLAAFLGASRRSIGAGATVGLGSVEDTLRRVEAIVAAGYRRVKLKVVPGRECVTRVAAVRDAHPSLVLSIDANGSFDDEDATHLAQLHALDSLVLAAIEQPLSRDNLAGHARLVKELAGPVVLDESLDSLAALHAAIKAKALDGASIKPARLGGILAARAAHDACVEAGVRLCLGGLFEAGIGRASALCVAALSGFDLPSDLGGSDRYFKTDLTPAHRLVDGELVVPSGPGLGVELVEEVVESHTVRALFFRA